jgi:hypothetical protein
MGADSAIFLKYFGSSFTALASAVDDNTWFYVP